MTNHTVICQLLSDLWWSHVLCSWAVTRLMAGFLDPNSFQIHQWQWEGLRPSLELTILLPQWLRGPLVWLTAHTLWMAAVVTFASLGQQPASWNNPFLDTSYMSSVWLLKRWPWPSNYLPLGSSPTPWPRWAPERDMGVCLSPKMTTQALLAVTHSGQAAGIDQGQRNYQPIQICLGSLFFNLISEVSDSFLRQVKTPFITLFLS